MPERFDLTFDCNIDNTKIHHEARDHAAWQRFLDIIEFLRSHYRTKGLPEKSEISLECVIDDTAIKHKVTDNYDAESFNKLLSLVDFIKAEHFEDTYSEFKIHTPVYITDGEFKGKFGVVINVFHEFITDGGYDNTTICISIGNKTVWINAEHVVMAEKLEVTLPTEGINEVEPEAHIPVSEPCETHVKISDEDQEVLLKELESAYTDNITPDPEHVTCSDKSPDYLMGKSVKLIKGDEKPVNGEQRLYDLTYTVTNHINGQYALLSADNTLVWRGSDQFHLTTTPLPSQEPGLPPKKNRSITAPDWTAEQLARLGTCRDQRDAVAKYREAYPETPRSYQDVQANFRKQKRIQNLSTDIESIRNSLKEESVAEPLVQQPEEKDNSPSRSNPYRRTGRPVIQQPEVDDFLPEPVKTVTLKITGRSNDIPFCGDSPILISDDSQLSEPDPEPNHEPAPQFIRDSKIRPINGYRSPFSGVGEVKRTNMINGDILVEFMNGRDWITAKNQINYELVPEKGVSVKN